MHYHKKLQVSQCDTIWLFITSLFFSKESFNNVLTKRFKHHNVLYIHINSGLTQNPRTVSKQAYECLVESKINFPFPTTEVLILHLKLHSPRTDYHFIQISTFTNISIIEFPNEVFHTQFPTQLVSFIRFIYTSISFLDPSHKVKRFNDSGQMTKLQESQCSKSARKTQFIWAWNIVNRSNNW